MSSIQAHILLVTVTPVESRAVLAAFREAAGRVAQPIAIDDRVYHDLGMLGGTRVFLTLSEMGAIGLGASQQAVQKGIAALRPAAVIMVGIAFGVDETRQQIGDILVSQQLWLYEIARHSTDAIVPRGDRPHASARLLNYLRSAELSWEQPRVRFGLVLTGEKLIDNVDYRNALRALATEAIGGEMEGAGLYAACQDARVDWILVKAICDWADGTKDQDKDARQELAARNAAGFVVHALQYVPFRTAQPAPAPPQRLVSTTRTTPAPPPVGSKTHVYLAYAPDVAADVEQLALQLKGDARLDFFFAPWHERSGKPLQEQLEDAMQQSQVCAVFLSGELPIEYQYEAMRLAIQTRIEDDTSFRVIPVFLPGPTKLSKRDLPALLRRYASVEFPALDDAQAYRRLLAGMLGKPPIEIEGFLATTVQNERLPPPPAGRFAHGHALVIGVANYPNINPLPEVVLNDAQELHATLISSACGYEEGKVTLLLDGEATSAAIRQALRDLAARTGPDDTAVVFFSGHGAHNPRGDDAQQFILPYDCNPANLPGSAIAGDELTALIRDIQAGRVLVLFDSCHSGGAAEPKNGLPTLKLGFSEDYYQTLAQGHGRVVIASSRPNELSWVLHGMAHSLFTHYLLEALRGQGPSLGDGYVRVFDLFRHVAANVPKRTEQHPIFKSAEVEDDFPVALVSQG
jgi:nucleoside phosphorylase